MSKNWNESANSDAREMLGYFLETIAEKAQCGDVSNDFDNGYPGGDSYHHENHVDREYSLLEAAELLEALADDEETDSGLWEGLEPRQAVSAQAAYTYGNAVASRWSTLIDTLNEEYLKGEDNELKRESYARLYVLLVSWFNAEAGEGEAGGFARLALEDVRRGDVFRALVFADWLSDHGRDSIAKDIRAAAALAVQEEKEETADAE